MQNDQCEHCGKVVAELVRLHGQRKASAAGRAAQVRLENAGKVSGAIPFGMRVAADGTTLINDSAEARVIARMRALRSDGSGYHAIAAALNRAGAKTKKGGKWFGKTVRGILLKITE